MFLTSFCSASRATLMRIDNPCSLAGSARAPGNQSLLAKAHNFCVTYQVLESLYNTAFKDYQLVLCHGSACIPAHQPFSASRSSFKLKMADRRTVWRNSPRLSLVLFIVVID